MPCGANITLIDNKNAPQKFVSVYVSPFTPLNKPSYCTKFWKERCIYIKTWIEMFKPKTHHKQWLLLSSYSLSCYLWAFSLHHPTWWVITVVVVVVLRCFRRPATASSAQATTSSTPGMGLKSGVITPPCGFLHS